MKSSISLNKKLDNISIHSEFILDKKIGEGAFGEIYIAKSNITNKSVAVKLVN